MSTWGSAEGLLLERERRSEQRVRKAAAKRRGDSGLGAAGAGPSGDAPHRAAGSKRSKASGKAAQPAPVLQREHEHEFLPDEEYDAESDTWTKRCACGFSVSYEKI